jgi:nitrate reductase delta subunit
VAAVSAYLELAHLLDYPRELPAVRDAADPGVRAFLRSLKGVALEELQAEYVETFDFDRRAALHLTYHVHGDKRQRGLELVRLKRRIAAAGFELDPRELPDYLPALLELAAVRPEVGRELLAELREPLELVRSRLHDRGSRFAPLLDSVVRSLPALTARQVARIRELAAEGPPSELVGLEPFPVGGGAA